MRPQLIFGSASTVPQVLLSTQSLMMEPNTVENQESRHAMRLRVMKLLSKTANVTTHVELAAVATKVGSVIQYCQINASIVKMV